MLLINIIMVPFVQRRGDTHPGHDQHSQTGTRSLGLDNLVVRGHGVDTERFRPGTRSGRNRPRLIYVGRVGIEKNIESFLSLDMDSVAAPLSGRLDGLPLR